MRNHHISIVLIVLVFLLFSLLSVYANSPPTTPTLISPTGGETMNEITSVTWNPSTDPDGDSLFYTLEYSTNSGANWDPLIERIGLQNTFDDGTNTATFPSPGSVNLNFDMLKPSTVTKATLALTGDTARKDYGWFVNTAPPISDSGANFARLWMDISDKVIVPGAVLTSFTVERNSGTASNWNVRVCEVQNIGSTTCDTLIQDWTQTTCSVGAGGYPQPCQEEDDLIGYSDIHFLLNDLQPAGSILLFEIQSIAGPNGDDTYYYAGNAINTSGLSFEIYGPHVLGGTKTFTDAQTRLGYSEDVYPENIAIDIGDDGSIEHTIQGPITATPTIVDLNTAAITSLVDTCDQGFDNTCDSIVPFSISGGTEGILTVDDLQIYYDVPSYSWVSNYFPLSSQYQLRIKASDGSLESAYDTSLDFSVAYDLEECGQILTDGCNITQDTTLLYGTHTAKNMRIKSNMTTTDCNDAILDGIPGSQGIDLAFTIARTNGTIIQNCNFQDYDYSITSCDNLDGCLPAYNALIQNNKFTEVSLAGIQFRSEVDMISPDNPFEGANKILNNQILETNLGGKGIDLRKAKYTSIKNNVFRNNLPESGFNPPSNTKGIYLELAPDTQIRENIIEGFDDGIKIGGNGQFDSNNNNNVIRENYITKNNRAIKMDAGAANNIVFNNTVENNNILGVELLNTINNYVIQNKFVNNGQHISDNAQSALSFLTTGNGHDTYDEYSEGCIDDLPPYGRCDTPLSVPLANTDPYPIVKGASGQFLTAPGHEDEPLLHDIPPIITEVQTTTGFSGTTPTPSVITIDASGIQGSVLTYDLDPSPIPLSQFTQQGNVFTWNIPPSTPIGFYTLKALISDGELIREKTFEVTVCKRLRRSAGPGVTIDSGCPVKGPASPQLNI